MRRRGRSANEGTSDYSQLKSHLRNKDLNSALGALERLEQQAGPGRLERGKAAYARWKVRRAATRLGKEAIENGEAARDQQADSTLAAVPGQAKEARRQINDAVTNGQLTSEQAQGELDQLRHEIRQFHQQHRSSGSNYRQARRALDHIARTSKKYDGKPVQRVLARLGRLVLGSAERSHNKLDRKLISRANKLSKKGVDGATQARLLLLEAKARGLEGSFKYNRAENKAVRRLAGVIKRAAKLGDPAAVEQAYTLKEAYGVDRHGSDYRLSDRAAQRMNRDINRARVNLANAFSRQAAWIVKYPQIAAQMMGYGPEMAAQINLLARQQAQVAIDSGFKVSRRVLSRIRSNDKKLNKKNPGLLRSIAVTALKGVALPVTLPLKFVKWATYTQYRYFRYSQTGGVPPPPIAPEKFNVLVQKYASDGYAQQTQQQAQNVSNNPYM